MPRAILILLVCLSVAFSSTAVAAEKSARVLPYSNGNVTGWKAVVSDYSYAPSFLIAVDKKDQVLTVFERKSPLSQIAEYDCTTGQNEGDKLVEGDLKTPEGVYFVVKHITSGLDYSLYGYEAYPLNYPNPVDRIRKKTGYGIWIHGKGVPIVPYDSNGCVGMYNKDIATFKKKPLIGQPVAMAVHVEHADKPSGEKSATAAMLAAKVEAWAKAWGNRSAEMFSYYNPTLYSIAQGESFSAFKAQKERLFKSLPWIKTTVHDIQVLEGPGYWVTWFNQDYSAPNLTSSGTRRLYWQADDDGEMRIVGMEWLNGFKSPVLYAEAKPATSTDASPAASKPAQPAPEKPAAAVAAAKPAPEKPVTTAAAKPVQPVAEKPAATVAEAKPVPARPAAPAAAKPAPIPSTSTAPRVVAPAPKAAPAPAPKAEVASAPTPKPAPAPRVVPAKQPEPTRVALATKPEPKPVQAPKPALSTPANTPTNEIDAMRMAQGREFIIAWRDAWRKRDLAAYGRCYAEAAVQGGRHGAKAIVAHKTQVWSNIRVARLDLSSISIEPTENGLKAVMRQDYSDSRGYADKGVKVLYLEYTNNAWRIVREDWKPLVTQ